MLFALSMLAGLSAPEIAQRLRAVADQYYAASPAVARVTSRYSTLDYYTRLRDDADVWSDPSSFHGSAENRADFEAMSELDISLATQLMRQTYEPLGSIRGLGETLIRSSKDGTMQPVAVYVPRQYSPGQPAQLVIFLHGRNQPESHLVPLPPITRLAEQTNTIVIAPYGRGTFDFAGSESDVYDAYAAATQAFNVAPDHRYLAGYSMGCFAAFGIGPMRPGDWSALLCVAGALVQQNAAVTTTKLRTLRFYLVSGQQDTIVPTKWAELSASYLRDAGLSVSLYLQPDGTHDLRTLGTMLPRAWDDMQHGAVHPPSNLPGGQGLPIGNPPASF